jgi:hypothetical protein
MLGALGWSCKQLLYGDLASGRRQIGGQRKRFKDSLKVSLKSLDVDIDTLETTARDRSCRGSCISKGGKHDEDSRTNRAMEKRQLRKMRSFLQQIT